MNRKVPLWERTREAAREALRPMRTSGHAVRRRTRVVAGALCIAMLGLGWRAFDVAVLKHDEYLQQGNRQQLRTFRLRAGRGDILDRNYVSLAVNNQSFRVVLNPRLIRGQRREAEGQQQSGSRRRSRSGNGGARRHWAASGLERRS